MRTHHVVLIMLSIAVFIAIHATLGLFSKHKGIKKVVFGGSPA
jgi:hypothetical protein